MTPILRLRAGVACGDAGAARREGADRRLSLSFAALMRWLSLLLPGPDADVDGDSADGLAFAVRGVREAGTVGERAPAEAVGDNITAGVSTGSSGGVGDRSTGSNIGELCLKRGERGLGDGARGGASRLISADVSGSSHSGALTCPVAVASAAEVDPGSLSSTCNTSDMSVAKLWSWFPCLKGSAGDATRTEDAEGEGEGEARAMAKAGSEADFCCSTIHAGGFNLPGTAFLSFPVMVNVGSSPLSVVAAAAGDRRVGGGKLIEVGDAAAPGADQI